MLISKDKKTKTVPFFQGNALAYIIIACIFTPMGAMLADFSWTIFYIYTVMNILVVIICRILYSRIEMLIIYNSIVAFFMVIHLGISTTVPFFVLLHGTPLFYISIAITIFLFLFSYSRRVKLAEAANNSFSGYTFRLLYLFVGVMGVIGALMTRNGQDMILMTIIEEESRAFFQMGFVYLLGLLFFYLSPSLLVNPYKDKSKK
ncbi:hypothetical protein [Mangrovibacillus cuniculi]|uniref:Uncharacterized protein n=1 Tax=Mangrovibacillus cuniculi TaxID=2593652 RepID=A0A7S8HGY3_9BACI|nr:hypothetical protein [Mangrovibacillus cuniculi]QPC48277.1 hypothetical protein G8O30_15800 [Mangrovibacillus cuniculi]